MKIKLRKIGNSLGVIFKKNVITNSRAGDYIEVNVITSGENVITLPVAKKNVITSHTTKFKTYFKK